MVDILIQPNAAADDDLSGGIVIDDATLPLSAQDADALGLTLGTNYKARVLGDPQVFSVTDVPEAFVDGDWSVATGETGPTLDITVAELPAANGKTITDIEYDLNASGVWASLGGATTGEYTITPPAASTSYAVRLRAVNDNGEGDPGNSESATSGAGGAAAAALGGQIYVDATRVWASLQSDTDGGTVYALVDTSPSTPAATVKASAMDTASGVDLTGYHSNFIEVTGLTEGASGLYLHIVQDVDDAGAFSNVRRHGPFTMKEQGRFVGAGKRTTTDFQINIANASVADRTEFFFGCIFVDAAGDFKRLLAHAGSSTLVKRPANATRVTIGDGTDASGNLDLSGQAYRPGEPIALMLSVQQAEAPDTGVVVQVAICKGSNFQGTSGWTVTTFDSANTPALANVDAMAVAGQTAELIGGLNGAAIRWVMGDSYADLTSAAVQNAFFDAATVAPISDDTLLRAAVSNVTDDFFGGEDDFAAGINAGSRGQTGVSVAGA